MCGGLPALGVMLTSGATLFAALIVTWNSGFTPHKSKWFSVSKRWSSLISEFLVCCTSEFCATSVTFLLDPDWDPFWRFRLYVGDLGRFSGELLNDGSASSFSLLVWLHSAKDESLLYIPHSRQEWWTGTGWGCRICHVIYFWASSPSNLSVPREDLFSNVITNINIDMFE